jgi:3-phosphoshikimate 1-carboxyvinyltransferase
MSAATSLPAQLPVVPFPKPVSGEVQIPGSKSLTNRALLLAALCEKPVTLTGALFSDDTRLMAKALNNLGYTVEPNEDAKTIVVRDQSSAFQSSELIDIFVGLAGTAARFLTALCAAAPRGVYRIQGTERMNQRPMKGLIDALRSLGADIRCTGVEGFFPIEITARGLRGGEVSIDSTESSQMLSALFMVAPLADEEVRIRPVGGYREPFVRMTAQFCAEFGLGTPRLVPGGVIVAPFGKYQSRGTYRIEPDATAASYFAALPLVTGGEIHLSGLKGSGFGLQGDTRFLDILELVGGKIARRLGEPTPFGDPDVIGTDISHSRTIRLKGVTQDFSEFSDTFLTLAAIAPLLSGPTTITGIAHTRKQETDRVAGMVAELRRLGQEVDEHADGDGLTITPRPLKSGQVIQTYHDHRFAMSFAILGSHDLHRDGRPWLTIDNPACCAKTFPNFFDVLDSLRRLAHA